jgi:hypothetical protein
MREINKIAEGLFEKIRDRYEDVSLGDAKANATQNPEDARFFNFDYVVDGKNYGNITLSIIDETSLKVYFSKNISHDLDDEQRKEWYAFLKELREFAKRNLLSFEPRDITRSTLKHRDIKQVSKSDDTYDKDEVVSESRLYGTSRSSYENDGPVKIIIRHSDHIDPEQRGSRSRKIRAMYLETADGERFKLSENNLRYARAMARHVSEGGQINDEFGQHITEVAQECGKLRPFKAAMVRRVFEDEETKSMVEAAFEYHSLLKNTLGKMSGRKGYQQCKEQFVATSTSYIPEEDFDVNALKERFVKRTFNERMSDALPIVYKAYNMKKTNKFAESFESWANTVAESWNEEDDAQQWDNEPINVDDLADVFAEELPLGVDAVNAVNAISGIINSNELEELLLHSSRENPEADAREIIMNWVYNNAPAAYQELRDFSEVESSDQRLGESDTGDTPYTKMSRSELLDYLQLDPLIAQHIPNEKLRAKAEEKSQDMTEGNTYGSSDGGMDGTVYEEDHEDDSDESDQDIDNPDQFNREMSEGEYDEDQVESIQTAIIRRITNNIGQHQELLMKAGPDGVMNAARDVASFHAPMEELGSSDVSAMVRQVYNEVGVEYPEMNEADANTVEKPLTRHVRSPSKKAKDAKYYDYLARTLGESLEAMAPADSSSPLSHAQEEYCDKCDSAKCCCDDLNEGKIKEVDMDLKDLTDEEFRAKYSKSKEEMKAALAEGYDDVVDKDEKMKRMGAKELSTLDKLKIMPSQMKAFAKGDSEDDLLHYNKMKSTNEDAQFNEDMIQMRRIAGLIK